MNDKNNDTNSGGNPENNPEFPEKKSSTEVRYVPLDYLAHMQEDDDEIDIMELIRTVWEGRTLIYKTIGVFIVLGLIVALGSSEVYTSQVTLLPESQQTSTLGSLSGIARQFGISAGGSSGTEEGIPTSLYPDLTQSVVLMERLMQFEVQPTGLDNPVTLFEYYTEHGSPSFVSVLSKYTIQLPFTILRWVRNLFKSENPDAGLLLAGRPGQDRVVRLSDEEWVVVRLLRENVSTRISETNGTVTVSVNMPEPMMAAEVVSHVVDLLSEFIINYRTEKTRADLKFIEARVEESRLRFEEARSELARFTDENPGQLTATAGIREQHLQNQYNLTYNLYNTMIERLEETRIKLQEETPVLNMLTPPVYPDQRSSPKRTRLMILFTMIGGVAGIGLIFGKKFWTSFREKMVEG